MEPGIAQGFRLSPEQRRLWGVLRESGAQAFRTVQLVRLRGELDAPAAAAALARAVERFEILGTTFRRLPGMELPLQVLGPARLVWRGVEDLFADAVPAPAARIEERLAEALAAPLDLENGPVVQVWSLRLSPRELVWIFCLPALNADLSSLAHLVREAGRQYRPDPAGGGEEPLQFVDLAQWQNDLLAAAEAGVDREIWLRRDLATAWRQPLPGRRRRPADDLVPAVVRTRLAADAAAPLSALAARWSRPPQELVAACWATLIRRLTDGPEVVLAAAFSGRRYAELGDALGPFVRYLPLVVRLTGGEPWREVVAAVGRELAEADGRQELFDAQAVFAVAGGAFFPLAFDWEEGREESFAAGVTCELARGVGYADGFEVRLSAGWDGGALALDFHYDSGRFAPRDVERLAARFTRLLDAALADPEAPWEDLDILAPRERWELVSALAESDATPPTLEPVHALFGRQAALRPQEVAVRCGESSLTYAELEAGAERLARALVARGVGAGHFVPLLLDRSLAMVVALLGVLKAGAAYVPFDPALPAARRRAMLADLGASVVVATAADRDALPEGIALVEAHGAHEAGAAAPAEPLPVSAWPAAPAYALFTSGSTGRPKAVVVEHRQLSHYVQAVSQELGFAPGMHFAMVSTFAADLGVTALFGALCLGGCVHVLPQDRSGDPAALGEYAGRQPFDCLKIVPSHLAALLAAPQAARWLPRRHLVVGGEALTWELAEALRAAGAACEVVNEYGPTETTVGVVAYRFAPGAGRDDAATVPVGRPMPGSRVYLLDPRGEPAPYGVAGEIYVGGPGVTRGYLGRPDLTAERFLPDPFAAQPGGRLYRTGDLARRLGDGEIEFLGRADHQVKIRGFRVELGEIEAVAQEHAGVERAVVLHRTEAPADRQLVAFLVPRRQSAAPDSAEPAAAGPAAGRRRERLLAEVEALLCERLPEYMAPQQLVLLDELPLTPNGKADRQALAALADREAAPERGETVPRTPIEELLAGIWRQLLGRERIEIRRSFFELGGHSLLATRLLSRVREMFGVEIPLRALFDAPTVAGLAQSIEAAVARQEQRESPAIVPVPRDRPLPLSFAQQRLWLLDLMEPGLPAYNIPFAVSLQGELDPGALWGALAAIVHRHEVLRTTLDVADGEPVQVIAPPAPLPFPAIDLSALPATAREREVRERVGREARRPFDLYRGPLLRAALLRLGDAEHVALLTMHHIVTDGWSKAVIGDELSELYDALASGRPPRLPELPIQYADFAAWQRRWLAGELLERQVAYWRGQLRPPLPVLELPTVRPRPAVKSWRGSTESVALPLALSAELQGLSRREGATLFMTLLAGFYALLHRYTGADDIVIGCGVAGRIRPVVEKLIGCFINTLALRADLAGNPSFRELLVRVREVALGAYTHQDVPFEKLVEELQPERRHYHAPLFRVMFSLQNTPDERLELPRLSLGWLSARSETAKFDLILTMTETDVGLRGNLEYDLDLFDRAAARRMLDHLLAILAAVAADPEVRLIDIPLDGEAVRDAEPAELLAIAVDAGDEFDFA